VSNKVDRERRREARRAERRAEERRKDRLVTRIAVIGFVLIVGGALAFAGLGGAHRTLAVPTAASPAPAAPPPASGVPAQIAANLAEQNRVIDVSVGVKLAALRGVPVVVNQWASWCPNCKAEFGFFQREAQHYERQVAFLGLDAQDQRSGAEAFLRRFPVNYPSVFDESAQQAASLGGGQGWPTTFFIDHTGNETFVHEGAYASEAKLGADIRRYALGV
jgi:thiol-disulfide isomerase/thioredoxin